MRALQPVESQQGSLLSIEESGFLSSSTAHAIRPEGFPLDANRTDIPKMRPKPVKMSASNGADVATVFRGAELLGMPIIPQNVFVSAVLNARKPSGALKYSTVTVQIPRRAAKTTSLWEEWIGRCDTREHYRIAVSAQDGIRARQRFLDHVNLLRRQDFEGHRNPLNRRGQFRTAKGEETIEFDNGSFIRVVPPDAGAFRGDGYDVVHFDEAGELDIETLEELKGGVLPTFDTRPEGQIVLSGTPGKRRVGWFWEEIKNGLENKPGAGIVSYHLKDSQQLITTNDATNERVLNKRMLRRIHPGISSKLTTMQKMVERFEKMNEDQFLREYACLWPFDATASALNSVAWNAGATEMIPRPEKIGIGFDIDPDGSAGTLVASWRDAENDVYLEILGCRPGSDWIVREALKAFRKYRVPIAYDSIGANSDVANRLHRSGVAIEPMSLVNMYGASSRIADEIDRRKVKHFDQDDLNSAVEGATWRTTGERGRLFSRKNAEHPVHPLVAGSIALWSYDQNTRAGKRAGIIRS